MNVTQRNYTLNRIQQILNVKIKAVLAENDVLVKAHNDHYLITHDDFLELSKTNPEIVTIYKGSSTYCETSLSINYKLIRELLSKPDYYLHDSSRSYIDDCAKPHQQLISINNQNTVVLFDTADRIKKLQARACFAKDQVMLGDAKEALQALEDFNSLIF